MTYVVRLMNCSQEQLHQLAWLLQSEGHLCLQSVICGQQCARQQQDANCILFQQQSQQIITNLARRVLGQGIVSVDGTSFDLAFVLL